MLKCQDLALSVDYSEDPFSGGVYPIPTTARWMVYKSGSMYCSVTLAIIVILGGRDNLLSSRERDVAPW